AWELGGGGLGRRHGPAVAVVVEPDDLAQLGLVGADPVGLGERLPGAVRGAPLELGLARGARGAPLEAARGAVLLPARRELEDHGEVVLAGGEDVLVRPGAEAGGGAVQRPGHGVEQGALAAARGPGDREEVAPQAAEVDVVLAAEAAEVAQPQAFGPHRASSSASTRACSSANLLMTPSSRCPSCVSRQ